MRLGGRAAAAIDVLDAIEKQHRPASEALKDWGNSHRFAGSGDRAAIGNLVYDTLRRRASHAARMGTETPRALVLAVLIHDWGMDGEALNAAFSSDRFAPETLTESEQTHLAAALPEDTPDWARADIPEWLWPLFAGAFEEEAEAEGRGLADRPPLDLRANALKATRQKVLNALKRFGAKASPIALQGIRIPPTERDQRLPNLQAEAGYQKGWFEIQDEGSQIAAELVLAKPGEQVLDFCAGAGGKTLALAAIMENKGQVHAFDTDRHRLAPIHERLKRAGARNVQVHPPERASLTDLTGRMDRVIIDAPCSGSGVWRRHPDAKWKLTERALEARIDEQEQVLEEAAPFVRPGGFLTYITCSVLPPENEGQVYAFTERHPEFTLLSAGEAWEDLYGYDKPKPWSADGCSVTMTPASAGTDGFFFAVLERRPESA